MAALICLVRTEQDVDAPLVPAGWDRVLEDDRWCTVYPLGRKASPGVFFHCRLIARHPSFPTTRALFVCTGARVVLNHLADRIAADAISWTRTWLTLGELRADASAGATTIRGFWPDERPVDELGTPIGTLVALHRRMAGFGAENAE